jgi:hypothetical protein
MALMTSDEDRLVEIEENMMTEDVDEEVITDSVVPLAVNIAQPHLEQIVPERNGSATRTRFRKDVSKC